MSVLTKIFIVLATLLSVLLVALVVPFVVNTQTYKQQYQDTQSQLAVAQANAANREQDVAAAMQAQNKQNAAQQNQITDLSTQVNQLTGDRQALQTQLAEARSQAGDVRGELARLSAALQQASQINGMLQAELKQRRDEVVKLQTRSIELTNTLSDKTTQLETLTRQVRLFKEQMADLEGQNQKLRQQLETGGAVASTAGQGATQSGQQGFVSQVTLLGKVTEVKKIGDDLFVAINIGSNDKVKEGMRFMLHNGDKFLGNMVITQVDTNTAAGRVTLGPFGQIVAGVDVLAGGA